MPARGKAKKMHEQAAPAPKPKKGARAEKKSKLPKPGKPIPYKELMAKALSQSESEGEYSPRQSPRESEKEEPRRGGSRLLHNLVSTRELRAGRRRRKLAKEVEWCR
jgi:hypothetical protein